MKPIPWDRPIPFGQARTGVVEFPPLLHALVGGATNAGKSGVATAILTGLAQREFTQLVLIDPKVVELPVWQWGGRASCIASGPRSALTALRLVRTQMMDRYEWCEANRVKTWPPSEDRPRLVVLIDELAEVMLGPDGKEVEEVLQSILAMGRAAGVLMIDMTQQPDMGVIPTRLRNNHRQRICLGTESADQTKMVLGPDAGKIPCHKIPESRPGHGWVRVNRQFTEFRSFYVSDDQLESVIAATAHLRRDLPGFPAVIKQPLAVVAKGGKAA